MKKLIFLGFITVISIFFYGCCGGFGASGIDCTNYNASTTIFIKMNMDSSNLGFKIMELDSTYLIKYKSSKTNLYDNVIDMINMCAMISQNIGKEEITNVYGGKTPWGFFNDKPEFTRFIDYVVNKHRNSNPFFNKIIGMIRR